MTTTTTTTTTTATLAVPGATLYYETQGSGPLLLLIPGGAGDAGMYAAMTAELADRYTVVSYDQRCMSRSRLDGPLADQQVQVWSDDARRLLEHLSPHEEVPVMGCSSGAITALDLLARYPERVRRVIAHEPPLLELLEDPAPHRALFADVRETARSEGVATAMARFSAGLGGQAGDQEHPAEPETPAGREQEAELAPEIQQMAHRMYANMPVFLEHVLCPFSSSTPDLPALRTVAHKLVLAAGRDSRGRLPLYGPAARLADLVDCALVEFPGGHLGAVEEPQDFAEHLAGLLD